MQPMDSNEELESARAILRARLRPENREIQPIGPNEDFESIIARVGSIRRQTEARVGQEFLEARDLSPRAAAERIRTLGRNEHFREPPLDQRPPEPEFLEDQGYHLSHLRLQGEERNIATNSISEPCQDPSQSISLPDTGRSTVNNTVSNTANNNESRYMRPIVTQTRKSFEEFLTGLREQARALGQDPIETEEKLEPYRVRYRELVESGAIHTGSPTESNTKSTESFESASEQSNEQAGDFPIENSAQSGENVPADVVLPDTVTDMVTDMVSDTVSETGRTQEIKSGGFFFKLGRHINWENHRLIIGPKLEAGITNTGRPFLSLVGEVTIQPELSKFQLDFPNGSGNQMNFDVYWKKTHLFFEKGYTGSIPYAQGGILHDYESFLKKMKVGSFPYHYWGVGIKNKGSFWLWQDLQDYYFLGATDEFRKNVPGVSFLGGSLKTQSAFTLPPLFLPQVKPIVFLAKHEEIPSAIEDQRDQAQEYYFEIKSNIEDLNPDLPNSEKILPILGGSLIIPPLVSFIFTSFAQFCLVTIVGFVHAFVFYQISLLDTVEFKNKKTSSLMPFLRFFKYLFVYGPILSASLAVVNMTYNFVWNKPLLTKFEFLNTTSTSHRISKKAVESVGNLSAPVQVFFETQLWAFVKPYSKQIYPLLCANPLWRFSFTMVGLVAGNLPLIFISFRIYRTRSLWQGIWIIVCFGLMFSRRSFFQEFLVAEKCPPLFSDKEMTKKENLQKLAKISRICAAGIIKGFGLGGVVKVMTNRVSPRN